MTAPRLVCLVCGDTPVASGGIGAACPSCGHKFLNFMADRLMAALTLYASPPSDLSEYSEAIRLDVPEVLAALASISPELSLREKLETALRNGRLLCGTERAYMASLPDRPVPAEYEDAVKAMLWPIAPPRHLA